MGCRGRKGARELARLLAEELPDAPYTYTNQLIEGLADRCRWLAERGQDQRGRRLADRGRVACDPRVHRLQPERPRPHDQTRVPHDICGCAR
jgi:hypothetical protein